MTQYGRIDQWTDELAAKGRKPHTIITYNTNARLMMRELERAGMSTDPQDIDARSIRRLMGIRSDMTTTTLRGNLWALGAYVEWETGRNPYKDADILWGSDDRPNRVYVSEEDLRSTLDDADEATTLILALGACMGLRRGEIAGLRLSDIHGSRLRVVGKGRGIGKIVSMHIPEAVYRALADWMVAREEMRARVREDLSDGHLLVTIKYNALRPMTPEGVYYKVRKLSQATGVRMTPHSLRRRFATNLHDAGVDIVDIKTLMRHDSIDTTIECYIKPNDRKLDSIMAGMEI